MAKNCYKPRFYASVPVVLCGFFAISATSYAANSNVNESSIADGVGNLLPPAKSGECYAKVSVPAKYKTEAVSVLLKQGTERFRITPAKFETKSKDVLIRDASSELVAVQPEISVEKDKFIVSPAKTLWVRDSLESDIPMSAGEKRDISVAGIKLDDMPVGSCLYEHYRADVTKQVPNKVLISEATEKLEVMPAKFRKATESVLIKPMHKRLVEVPAVYKTAQEKVMVEAASKVWKKGTGPIQRIDNLSGEIMCLVDVPPVYETIDTEVVATKPLVTSVVEKAVYKTLEIEKLEADAKEKRSPVAAQFKTMSKEQIAQAGGYSWLKKRSENAANGKPTGRTVCHRSIPAKEIAYERSVVKTAGAYTRTKVPATFESIEVSSLVSDATSVSSAVPPVNGTVEKRIKVADARFEWMSVLCETNTNGDIITRLQTALAKNGYAPGSIDGVLGQGTLSALQKFQKKNKLAEGGVTMESIKALGVEL